MPWNIGLVYERTEGGVWAPVLASFRFYHVVWSPTLGKFVLFGSAGGSSSRSWTSTDGITWTINATTASLGNPESYVSLDGGLIGYSSGSTTPSTIRTSADAITHTTRATSSSFEYKTLIPGSPNVVLIRSGLTNTNLGTSVDGGLTWSTSSIGVSPATRPVFLGLNGPKTPMGARIGSTWFAVGATKANTSDVGVWAGTSANGTTWTQQTSPIAGIGIANTTPGVWAVNGQFFLTKRVAGTGLVMYRSSTGTTGSWTQVTTLPIVNDSQVIMKMLYTSNKYVVIMGTTTTGIGTAPSEVYTSTNLSSWTALGIPIASTQTIIDAEWNNGTLVVVANNSGNTRFTSDVVGEVFTFTGLS